MGELAGFELERAAKLFRLDEQALSKAHNIT